MNYHFLYIICIIGAILSFIPRMSKYKDLILLYTGGILALFAGFRYWVGFEFHHYYIMFYDSPAVMDFLRKGYLFTWESGYLGLNTIFRRLGLEFNAVLLMMSILTLFLLIRAFKKLTPYVSLALLIYVSRFFFIRDMGEVRISLAAALILYSLEFLRKKQIWKFFSIVFVAFLFHRIALLGLLLYGFHCIFKKGIPTKWVIGFLGVAFVIGSLDWRTLILAVEPILPQRLWESLNQPEYIIPLGLSNPVLIMQTLIICGMLLFRKSLRSEKFELLLTGYVLSTIILAGFNYFGAIAGRLSTLFATFEVVIITLFIEIFKDKKIKKFGYWKPEYFIILGIFTYAVVIYHLVFVRDIMPYFMPYRSVLNP